MADNNELETWEANGRVVIRKSDARGNLAPFMVNRGKKFTITSMERELYQDRAASEETDPFKNGLLVPVRLIEGSDAQRLYADNPNTMAEEDIRKLFKSHWKVFEKKVAEISSPYILNRMLAMAEENDAGVTVRQASLVENRLDEVAPKSYTERTSEPIVRNPATLSSNPLV